MALPTRDVGSEVPFNLRRRADASILEVAREAYTNARRSYYTLTAAPISGKGGSWHSVFGRDDQGAAFAR
jgi:hypothetical protein